MAIKKLAAAVSICCAVLSYSAAAAEFTVTGKGATNSQDQFTTFGVIELTVKGTGRSSSTTRLVCGIKGELQSASGPFSLTFRHTVVCNDHSQFELTTNTAITPQGPCSGGGLVGTFNETSDVIGVAGPFAGVTGQLTTSGTINCAFNDFTTAGTLTRP